MVLFAVILFVGMLSRLSLVGEVLFWLSLGAFGISIIASGINWMENGGHKEEWVDYFVPPFKQVTNLIPTWIKTSVFLLMLLSAVVPKEVYLVSATGVLAGVQVVNSETVSPILDKASKLLETKLDEMIKENTSENPE